MPPFGGGEDFVGVGFPFEGGGVLVVFGDESVDGGLEVRNGLTVMEIPVRMPQTRTPLPTWESP